MHSRERIATSIVEKYKDTIYFMVDIDQCHMEVVDPRTIWIISMGYEVEEKKLKMYAKNLLTMPLDLVEERFGTYEEKEHASL